MLILAMDFNGVAFWHLYGEGETVTGEAYRDFLDREITSWLQYTNFNSPILLHDNARPHKSGLVRDFLKARQYELWNHPPYLPDLNPCDFNCFNPLKHQLKRTRYTD
jgi:[histone H3]-lysine36 N-dimethyltransferase SETMAR